MRLTTKSEYSLLALIYMARHSSDRLVKVDDICREYGLSKKYMEQMLLTLKQNRYVIAKRGANGGYKLARQPDKISVAEIIRLMDGHIAPTQSVSKYYFTITPIHREKSALKVFKEIRNYVSDMLERLKISDLL